MGFFDKVDAGSYDPGLVVVLVGILLITFLWQRSVQRNAARQFYRARDRSQAAWKRHGSHHEATQLAILDALDAWSRWQGRSPEELDPDSPGNRTAEWDAISLIQALPAGDRTEWASA